MIPHLRHRVDPRRLRRALIRVAACAWFCLVPAVAQAGDRARIAVLCGPQRSYRDAASALQSILQTDGHECILIVLPKGNDQPARAQALDRLTTMNPGVIAACGPKATLWVLQVVPDVPVIFFMVPNALDAPFVAEGNPHRSRLAGVTTDVSPQDLVDWIVHLYPEGSNIGILHSPRSELTAKAIESAARQRGIAVSAIDARKDEFPKAIEALNHAGCDSVLMIPDARVYNSPNVQRLLLWGVRQKKPVWAFSENIVKAGAYAGLYSDSQAVGREAAELVRQVVRGADAPTLGLQYPRQTNKAVNRHTARMIGEPVRSTVASAEVKLYGE